MKYSYFTLENTTLIREGQGKNFHDLQRWDNGIWKSDAPALARYFFLGEGGREPISRREIIERFGREVFDAETVPA